MNNLVNYWSAYIAGNFADSILVWQRFLEIVGHLPGVTVISSIKHDFPGGGFSGLILLSESHAAIHTWPEYSTAWVELATCGDQKAIGVFRDRLVVFEANAATPTAPLINQD